MSFLSKLFGGKKEEEAPEPAEPMTEEAPAPVVEPAPEPAPEPAEEAPGEGDESEEKPEM